MSNEKSRPVKYFMKYIRASFNLNGICAAYSGLVVLWYLLWIIVGDSNWWLVLINRYIAYLLSYPLLLLAGILFLQRRKQRRKPVILLVSPLIVFVLIYHPYVFPKSAKPVDEANALRVMTYNVLYSNFDYDSVANVILTHQPDLVALQEVMPEMMIALTERLKDTYPYSLPATHRNFASTAIFSRYEFVETQVVDLQVDRRATIVKMLIREQEVTFVSIHLLAYGLRWYKLIDIPDAVIELTKIQNHQAEIVLGQIDDEAGVVLVGCDCNTYETSSTYQILDKSLNNAAREVGLRLLPFENPSGVRQDISFEHIDYVWYRGAVNPLRVYKIIDSGGSDHLPVIAVFELEVGK